MRASVSKPTTFIYLAIEKTDLIVQNVDPFIYCPFTLYPFIAGGYTNIAVNSLNTKRTSTLDKTLSKKKKYTHIPGCQKCWAFHIQIKKNRVTCSHILFVRKRGPIIYLAVLKRGLFGTHIRTMSYIGSYTPPHTHTHTHTPRGLLSNQYKCICHISI